MNIFMNIQRYILFKTNHLFYFVYIRSNQQQNIYQIPQKRILYKIHFFHLILVLQSIQKISMFMIHSKILERILEMNLNQRRVILQMLNKEMTGKSKKIIRLKNVISY